MEFWLGFIVGDIVTSFTFVAVIYVLGTWDD